MLATGDLESGQSESLVDAEKVNLLKDSVNQIINPAFLCEIKPDNPYYLEIIECNDKFSQQFDLTKEEVLGSSYDFLLSDNEVDYGSNNYSEYIRLLKSVKNLQVTDVKIDIAYPKNKLKVDGFKISFIPSRYKTKNTYCVFIFEKFLDSARVIESGDPQSSFLIQNLERALRNERILRSISDLIASDADLREIATIIAKILCDYLKVDRCILHNYKNNPLINSINNQIGFLAEHCADKVKKLSTDIEDPSSAINRYINSGQQLFSDINRLRKSNTILVYEDMRNDLQFKAIEDVCDDFGIGAQIIVVTAFGGLISGGVYVHQATPRKWLIEEIELVEIVSSQFAMAIDRANYVDEMVISNQELSKKTLQLKKALREEKKMRQMQTEFVAMVSHEFKTPLQIIDGSRELISRKLKALTVVDEFVDKSLERIKSGISRMNNLIQETLNLSKLEIASEGIAANKQDFDIKSLIKDIVEKNSNLATEKKITIAFDIEKLPNIYKGDQKLLDHCFTNIVTNAVKYSKSNSSVKISGFAENDQLVIRVVDSGIGIPKDDLEKIGKKFFRASNTLSVAGTGIGLYLTKYFIELHNGSVLIESEINVGTTITVFLPIVK